MMTYKTCNDAVNILYLEHLFMATRWPFEIIIIIINIPFLILISKIQSQW